MVIVLYLIPKITRDFVLAGYEDTPTIVIDYYIPGGTQSEWHPHPGRLFHGVNKKAYVPCTSEGDEIARVGPQFG